MGKLCSCLFYAFWLAIITSVGAQNVEFDQTSYTATVGKSIEITCHLSDGLQFQGFYNQTKQKISNGGRYLITSRNNNKLYKLEISSVVEEDHGVYTCLASDNSNATTTLRIQVSLQNLQSIYRILLGKRGQIKVRIAGYPRPRIVWYRFITGKITFIIERLKDGSIRNDSKYFIDEDGSLFINNVTKSDSGTYRVRSQNVGDIAEKSTRIIVGEKPKIVITPTRTLNVTENSDIKISCKFNNIELPKWTHITKNGGRITLTDSSRIQITKETLMIKSAVRSDEGMYNCSFSNDFGLTSAISHLQYVIKTESITMTQNQTVEQGGNATISCSSSGYPPPSIIWYYGSNREPIRSAGNKVITASPGQSTLLVVGVGINDAGLYMCKANYGKTVDGKEHSSNAITEVAVQGKTGAVAASCPAFSTFLVTSRATICRCQAGYVIRGQQCVTGKIFLISDVRFGITWVSQYALKLSKEFLELAEEMEAAFTRGFQSVGGLGCKIIDMKQGSVIVSLNLVLPPSSKVTAKQIQSVAKALLNGTTLKKWLPLASASLTVAGSDQCRANGTTCWPNSHCFDPKNGQSYRCICNDGYTLVPVNKCEVKPVPKESKTSIAEKLIPLYCVLGVLVLIIVILLLVRHILKNKQKSEQAKSRGSELHAGPLPRLDTLSSKEPHYASYNRAVSGGESDYSSVQEQYYSYPKFKDAGRGSSRGTNANGGVQQEPLYAVYGTADYQELNTNETRNNTESQYQHFQAKVEQGAATDTEPTKEPFYALYDDSHRNSAKE